MAVRLEPTVGQWYRDLGNDLYFTVVAIDAEEDTVELQHFDGAVEELDLTEWSLRDLEEAAEPEDWTGPLDTVDPDEWDQGVGPADLRVQTPLDEEGVD